MNHLVVKTLYVLLHYYNFWIFKKPNQPTILYLKHRFRNFLTYILSINNSHSSKYDLQSHPPLFYFLHFLRPLLLSLQLPSDLNIICFSILRWLLCTLVCLDLGLDAINKVRSVMDWTFLAIFRQPAFMDV